MNPIDFSERAAKIGALAYQNTPKISAEFLAITYGAVVSEMVEHLSQEDNVELVNQQLLDMGKRIGGRLIEEFSVRSGAPRCHSFAQATETVALVGIKMFLGVEAEVSTLKDHPDSFSIVLHSNPLTLFVELPGDEHGPLRRQLWYSNIICGVIIGALALVGFQVEAGFVQDKLRGDAKDEIVIRYLRRERDTFQL